MRRDGSHGSVHDDEYATAGRDRLVQPAPVATAVVEFIYGGLANNPQRRGRALHLELAGLHAARRGDFRVVYRLDEATGSPSDVERYASAGT